MLRGSFASRLRERVQFGIALCCAAIVSCGSPSPSPPTTGGSPSQTITGTERLGWTQSAADAVELAAIGYALYVDNARVELIGATCGPSTGTADFSCSALLPSMTPGPHTLELASFVVSGTTVAESARSAPLQVTVSPPVSTRVAEPAPGWTHSAVVTRDGVRLRLEQLAGTVVEPTDFAFSPDGRLFVAERAGRIRIVRDGRLLAQPALSLHESEPGQPRLITLAVDPRFEQTHYVFAIFTVLSDSGGRTFGLARFREASDTLADRVILLDGVPASPAGEAASLRFGPDGKMFAAFDDGGLARLAGDLASPNGKILRLNADGTTPDDQAGGTPLYSYPYRSPRGLDWNPSAKTLWAADRDSQNSGRLNLVASNDVARRRGVLQAVLTLPAGTSPSSLAFYQNGSIPAMRGDLLVASEEGRHLLRIRPDPVTPTRVVATERLLQDQIGGIRIVAVAPDGVIYVGTANAVGRLVPDGH